MKYRKNRTRLLKVWNKSFDYIYVYMYVCNIYMMYKVLI